MTKTKRRNYAQSHRSVRISAKRFATSPWLPAYSTEEMVLGVYSRRFYPLTLCEDAVERYWHLRRGVVLFDVPEDPIQIAGPDAVALLERVFCRHVGKLMPGRATYAIACNHRGGILMDGVLMRLAADRFWYVMADGEFRPWLAAHAVGLDVTIADTRSWVLQVQGPKSMAVLADLLDGGAPEPFAYFSVHEATIGGEPFYLSRTGWTGEMGFELYTRNEGIDGPAMFARIMAAGAPHGMVFSSLESMGIRRIEAAILDNGTDMDPSMTPWQAGLGRFVDLDKPGGFVGREALAAAPRDSLMFGLTCAATTPVAGDTVLKGGTRVGRITAGAWSPALATGIAYVRFDGPGHGPGDAVELGSGGDRHMATVVALPFYDAEKKIPRGLATAEV